MKYTHITVAPSLEKRLTGGTVEQSIQQSILNYPELSHHSTSTSAGKLRGAGVLMSLSATG